MSNAGDGAADSVLATAMQHGSVAPSRAEWSIASDIREIEPMVAKVTQLCRAVGLPARACRFNVPVALTEALSNAIMRGNAGNLARQVFITAIVDASALVLEITDEGQGFDPSSVTYSPDDADWLEREDGRGLFLMRSLMDRVDIVRSEGRETGQTVRLVLHRP